VIRLRDLLDMLLDHQASADGLDIIDMRLPSGEVVAPAEQ